MQFRQGSPIPPQWRIRPQHMQGEPEPNFRGSVVQPDRAVGFYPSDSGSNPDRTSNNIRCFS